MAGVFFWFDGRSHKSAHLRRYDNRDAFTDLTVRACHPPLRNIDLVTFGLKPVQPIHNFRLSVDTNQRKNEKRAEITRNLILFPLRLDPRLKGGGVLIDGVKPRVEVTAFLHYACV